MNKPVILASTSPRRIEIMGWLGVPFTSIPSIFDEKQIRHTSPKKLTRLLAEAKARAVTDDYPSAIVIGSDAVVSFKNRIIEKPTDKAHQKKLLHMQKGREGKVYASVCVIDTATGETVVKTKTTRYKVAELTTEEIEAYITSGQGLDKAGGFGLQDENGLFIDTLEGCFSNAMGFPACTVSRILKRMDIPVTVHVREAVKVKTGRRC